MSTRLQSHTSSVPAKRAFPKLDRFFDTAEHIVERSGSLLSKSETALIKLFLPVHLVIDLVVVLIFVLTK
jgi:hypothetical protein